MTRLFALTALLAASNIAHAATQFTATLDAAQIVGVTPSAAGTATVSATLSGGPGTWKFSYVGDFFNYDFGAYMLPFVTTGTSPADGTASLTATTATLADDVRSFHIHTGARGATGPVAYSVRAPDRENGIEPNVQIALLSATHARISGSWDLNDGQIGGTNVQTQQGNLAFWAPLMASANAGEEIALYFDIHTNGVPSSEIRGQITAVPLPAASWLLLGGVAMLGRLRRHSV
jgi:hypothetical protein